MKSNSKRRIVHQPSITQIDAARQIYEKVLGWKKMDKILYDFCNQYPLNVDPDPVLLKIELVDSLYRCNLRMNKVTITQDIINHNLDIANGDRLQIIDQIAELKPGHKRLGWVFASKYCHFHVPDKYPIIDSKAKKGLKQFMEKTKWDHYNSYSNFVDDVDQIISGIDGEVSYKDMDIFLYLTGQYLDYRKRKTGIASTVKAIFDTKTNNGLVQKLLGN